MPAIKELHEQRAKLLADCRTLVDAQEKTGELMDGEKRAQYDKMWEEQGKLKARIADLERLAEAEQSVAAMTESRGLQSEHESLETPGDEGAELKPYKWEYRGVESVIQPGTSLYETTTEDYRRHFCRFLINGETRALQADSDIKGGYTVPRQFVAELVKAVDNLLWMKQAARVFMLTQASSMGAPALDNDPADDTWTTEIGTGSADTTMSFGGRELTPHPLAKRLKVSRKLLRISALNIDALVRDRLAYKLAVTEEKAYLTGTGASQPLGVFVASANGINTGQDVSTGNTTTTIGADNLRECLYKLKPQHRMNANWLMHTDVVKAISKLKDGNGQYLWSPGITAGDPDVILGRSVRESQYSPNTFTTGKYLGILGDFSYYWIAQSLGVTIQRLEELYAESNEVGFINRLEIDGMPVLEEAFVRMTLA